MSLLERVCATGRRAGMHDIRVADFTPFLPTVYGVKPGIFDELTRAISMVTRLSDPVLEDIVDHPTKIYYYHYRRVNVMLDQAAHLVAALLMEEGFAAMPIPVSQVLDWVNMRAIISHRDIALAAGMGHHGRNNLLVHREFGSRVRLITVLTDAPLPVSDPYDGGCGNCYSCLAACPGGHIHDTPREFDRAGCMATIRQMKKKYNVGQDICGICVRACRGPR